jgi:hypothetical protein
MEVKEHEWRMEDAKKKRRKQSESETVRESLDLACSASANADWKKIKTRN